MLEEKSYLALWFGGRNLFLISGGTEKKLWDFQNAQTVSLQNSCYIEGEVLLRDKTAKQPVYIYSTCSTSYLILFSRVANTRPQAVFLFHIFLFLLDQTPFVNLQR